MNKSLKLESGSWRLITPSHTTAISWKNLSSIFRVVVQNWPKLIQITFNSHWEERKSSWGLRIFLCPIKKGPHWDSEFFLCPTLASRRKKKTSFSKENMIKKSRLPEAREIQVTDWLTAPQFHLISFLIGLGGSTFFFFFYTNHEALSDKHTFTGYYRHRTENCSTRRIKISKCSLEYSLLQHAPLEEIFFLLRTGLIVGPGTFSYFCWVLCVGVVTVVGGR